MELKFRRGRLHKVYYNKRGEDYIIYKGRRYYLNDMFYTYDRPDLFPEHIHAVLNLFACNCFTVDLYLNFDEFYTEDKIRLYYLINDEN